MPKEFYRNFVNQAIDISKNFDEEDAPFIATIPKLVVPIWTNDKNVIRYGLTLKTLGYKYKSIRRFA